MDAGLRVKRCQCARKVVRVGSSQFRYAVAGVMIQKGGTELYTNA